MKETSGSQLGDIFERDVLKVDYDAPESNRHERRSPTEKTIEMENRSRGECFSNTVSKRSLTVPQTGEPRLRNRI